MVGRGLRSLAVWALLGALAVLACRWAGTVVADWVGGRRPPTGRLDLALADVAAVALAGCAVWAWAVTTVVLAQAIGTHRSTAASSATPTGTSPRQVRGVPVWAARAVLLACGLAVVTVTPAHAVDGEHGAPRSTPAAAGSLDGLRVPDRATGPAHRTEPAAQAPTPAPIPGPTPGGGASNRDRGEVVVSPGDSLWTIARDGLPAAQRDVSTVAKATAALYAANRDDVGTDPDLIHPGLRLHRPPDHPPRRPDSSRPAPDQPGPDQPAPDQPDQRSEP